MNNTNDHKGRIKQKLKTREKILNAAQGFLNAEAEFSLEDVAKNIGVSRATVYRYFSNIDILCAEAVLNLHTKSAKELIAEVYELNESNSLLYVQKYFNTLSQEHEIAFRKYISIVLTESTRKKSISRLRGLRRPEVYNQILESNKNRITKVNKRKLQQIATVLSGIEALIVNKDVNRLNNSESNELLKWALQMIIKGMNSKSK